VDGEEKWIVYRKDVEGMDLTSWLNLMLTSRRDVDKEHHSKYHPAYGDGSEGKHMCGQTEQCLPHPAGKF